MFSAKEDRLDWIANRTYLAEWVRAWLLKPDYSSAFHFHALEKEMATHSSILAGESQGRGSLMGCHLRGHTESETTEAT